MKRKMKTKILCTFLCVLLSFSSWAQIEAPEATDTDRPRWKDKVFFGGGGGVQFTNIGTFITVFPSVGYRLTPKWSSGVMGIYQYIHYRDIQRSTHNYGASLFTRYFVLPQVYATAEYEQLNMETISYREIGPRRWVDRMLVGAGYFQRTGRRGGFHFGLLYDVFYNASDPNYPYQSPLVYRIGFTF